MYFIQNIKIVSYSYFHLFIAKIRYNTYEACFIKLEIYNDAIEEYLDNMVKTLKESYQKSYLIFEEVDDMPQTAKEQIYNLLKTNGNYLPSTLDLNLR